MKYITIAAVLWLAASAYPADGQSPAPSTEPTVASASTASDHAPVLAERHPRYRLRKGDSLVLEFALSPEYNQTVAVEPDGYVTLKGAGSFFVEGQTVPELTDTVKTAYAKTLFDPIVTVALKDFEKPYFIAAGQVSRPGKYDCLGVITVTEAVALAGGFTEKSKHSQVVLFRPLPAGGYEARLLDIKKMLAARNLSEDVALKPGDMLYVPQNAISRIRPFLPSEGISAYLGSGVF